MLGKYLLAILLLLASALPVRADSTVAAMTAASALTGPELFYCVQGSADRKCTATQLQTFIGTGGGTTIGTSTITGGVSGNFLYNNAGVYGERTPAQTTAVLTPFSTATTAQGVVPGSNGAAATSFLNATGVWSVPGSSIVFPQTVSGTTTSGGIPYFSSPTVLSSSTVLTANLPVIGGGAGVAPTVGSVSGNTTKFATVNTTTFATGQCVQVDASLNLTTTGSACGAGGAGLPLVGTGLTYTTSTPLLDLSQTWNNVATTFTGLKFNVTNTASAAASRLMDLQVGGTTSAAITPDGWIAFPNNFANVIYKGVGNKGGNITFSDGVSLTFQIFTGVEYFFGMGTTLPISLSDNVLLFTDGVGLFAQRNLANAQTFRVYNTTDAGLANYERGVMDWTTTANTLIIGAQQLGTGQARQVNIAAPLHLGYTSGTPTANSCAGFALTTGSSDVAGKVTFTSATACSITFANAFTNAPFCVVSPGSAASTHDAVTSTTGLAVTFGTANTSMQWHCFGS